MVNAIRAVGFVLTAVGGFILGYSIKGAKLDGKHKKAKV